MLANAIPGIFGNSQALEVATRKCKREKNQQRIKFEDTHSSQNEPRSQGHRSGGGLLRIFDNKVERASREKRSGLA